MILFKLDQMSLITVAQVVIIMMGMAKYPISVHLSLTMRMLKFIQSLPNKKKLGRFLYL